MRLREEHAEEQEMLKTSYEKEMAFQRAEMQTAYEEDAHRKKECHKVRGSKMLIITSCVISYRYCILCIKRGGGNGLYSQKVRSFRWAFKQQRKGVT